MEAWGAILSLLSSLRFFVKQMLGKCGYKIVEKNSYVDEEVEVGFDYPKKSKLCLWEKENGAIFRWDKFMKEGYERYHEIKGDTRSFYTHRGSYLYIKRERS